MPSNRYYIALLAGFLAATISATAPGSAAAQSPPIANTKQDFLDKLGKPQQPLSLTIRGPKQDLAPDPKPLPSLADIAKLPYAELVDLRPSAASLIHFNTNSAQLKGDAHRILDELASALSGDLSDAVLMIVGHTDSQGSASYNIQLSRQRAQSVRSYLIAQGIEDSRLIAQGYGEAHPIEPNNTADGRALNRRSEFIRID